jgi:hypothetical protein
MTHTTRRATLVGAFAGACAIAAAPAAPAAPVSVNVRVEGATETHFEGSVATDGHAVTTVAGGTHPCDGTNNGAFQAPVPTPTAALDDAAKAGGFAWDGTWDDGFQDYFTTSIAGESQNPPSQFWGIYVNSVLAQTGGCQIELKQGDEVLFAFDAFSKTSVLELRGPRAATAGVPVAVTVVDGERGTPVEGAAVRGVRTGGDGRAALRFDTPGIYRLKAEAAGAVRSNALSLCVDRRGADPCSFGDSMAPRIDWRLPGRLASERGRSRTMLLSWAGDDGTGSGVASYGVEVRKLADGAGPDEPAPEWKRLLQGSKGTSLHYRGEAGDAYRFRITAVDRAANTATVETDPVVLPVDDRSRRLWRFSKGWKRTRTDAAWGGSVIRARGKARARFRFRGRRVALIGRLLPKGGRLRVTVKGRSKVLRLRGRSGHRSVLWTSRGLRAGEHRLTIRSLGRGPVELDAVAPLP